MFCPVCPWNFTKVKFKVKVHISTMVEALVPKGITVGKAVFVESRSKNVVKKFFLIGRGIQKKIQSKIQASYTFITMQFENF